MSRTPNVYRRLDKIGVEWLCDELINGRSLRSIAVELRTSATSLLKWLDREPGRMRQYELARQAQADCLVDELIELVDQPIPVGADGRMDPAAVNRLRLQIDARKWVASKFRPSVYGDKIEVATEVRPGRDQRPDEVMQRIVGFLASHGLQIVPTDAIEVRTPPGAT